MGAPFTFLFEELLHTICRLGHYTVVYYIASVKDGDKFCKEISLLTGLWSVVQINNSQNFTILSPVLSPKNILATSDSLLEIEEPVNEINSNCSNGVSKSKESSQTIHNKQMKIL